MSKYLVFMDLDGTLLNNDHKTISKRTKETIENLQKKGVIFYIATGRMYELAKITKGLLNDDVNLITSNGAVFDGASGREVVKLGRKAVELAYSLSHQNQMPMMLFTPESAYFTERIPRFIAQNAGNFDEAFGYRELHSLDELKAVEDEITNGVFLSRGNKEELEQVRQEFKDSGLLRVSSSSPENIEMIPLNTDKATAIAQIQKERQIDSNHTFVFGDGMNDLGMMKEAKYSVAMGNALPEVKQVANYETVKNTEDGIAVFLENYFAKHPLD